MDTPEKKPFVYTRTSPFHLRFIGFFVILFLFAIIPLVVLMSTRTTKGLNSHAAPSATIVVTSPQKIISIGQKIPVEVVIDPGNNLVSVVKLILTYDSTKVSTTSSIVLNPASFPVALTTPVQTCSGTTCHIAVTASIGADPTKVVQSKTIIGTLEFVALAAANPTQIAVDTGTQVLSADASNLPNQNVLSTTSPLSLHIVNMSPTTTPMICGGFIAHPQQCPTGFYCDHTGINPDLPGTCVPSPTCMPRPPCLDANPRCAIPEPTGGWCRLSPTPSAITPTAVSSGDVFASIAIAYPEIGSANNQLTHPTRSVTITLYNTQTKQSYTAVDTVKFDGKNSFVNTQFDLGQIPSGTYQLLLTMPQFLRKLLAQTDNTNVFFIKQGSTITVPRTQLIVGDIAPIPGKDDQPFGDNVLDIADYNQLISCYGIPSPKKCSDVGKLAADLNDDGVVDAIDYNILLRSFAFRQGDTTPFANVTVTGTPTLTPTPIQLGFTPTSIQLTVTPTCVVRPWCLDHTPYCGITEPVSGWCPYVSPTPTPTPIIIPSDSPTP